MSSKPTSYDPDSVWDYELGIKSAWLDRRLSVSAAVYDIRWDNIQQTVALPTCGVAVILNSGTASSKGAELEIQYTASFGLQLGLTAGFNDAKLTHNLPGAATQAGTPLLNFPKWGGSAFAEYNREIGARTSGYVRFDINSTSYKFETYDQTSLFYKEAGYTLANLRLGVKHEVWKAALFFHELV